MKKFILLILLVLLSGLFVLIYDYFGIDDDLTQKLPFIEHVKVDKIELNTDKDNDSITDLDDIVQGARIDAQNKPKYKDAYYAGGYPPDSEGVCTDVIWRALKSAGYNLKELVDNDIKNHISDYPRIKNEGPDPNIDFRRVPNLISFFRKYAEVLTTEIKPYDIENLKQWQGGDIVVFDQPHEHIAIVSDKRRPDGVPYMIHNSGPYTKENDMLQYWDKNLGKIIWHFRFPKVK